MNYLESATEKLNSLAKPPGSLGHLEQIATTIAKCQETLDPSADKIRVSIFAGDHGVAREEKVSPYPPSVTSLMVKTFLAGKAAISSIAKANNVELEVINCGVEGLSKETSSNLGDIKIFYEALADSPTKNLRKMSALSEEELSNAIQAGKNAAARVVTDKVDIAGAGEMGIGNTTAATAIFCKLLNLNPLDITGPGTGLDKNGISEKINVVSDAIERTSSSLTPWEVAKELGGFEIVAMASYFLELKKNKVPILLDGFITTAAAAVAMKVDPALKDYLIVTTVSGEPAHKLILEKLGLGKSIFNLGLRLGEGTGACLAASTVRSACNVINQMATLSDVLEGNL
jgi:nicotinate-nucleotide--dimethylbenzimidazole phosphoribosyltransferase